MLAEFLGLLGKLLHLGLDEFGLQSNKLLTVLGVHQPVREREGIGDITLGVADRLFADVLGAGLRDLGVSLKVATASWAADIKVLKAIRACSTLFSATARISVGISKRPIASLSMDSPPERQPTPFLTHNASDHINRFALPAESGEMLSRFGHAAQKNC